MVENNITDWLTELDLEVHIGLFVDNRIDFDVLPDLSEEDLRELGLPLGDRKRLMKAIIALSGGDDSVSGHEDGAVDASHLETLRDQCRELGLFGAMAELEAVII